MVIAPAYDAATDFVGNVAAVRRGERWALINKQGHLLSGFDFEAAVPVATQ
jgi:hypothetical protein